MDVCIIFWHVKLKYLKLRHELLNWITVIAFKAPQDYLNWNAINPCYSPSAEVEGNDGGITLLSDDAAASGDLGVSEKGNFLKTMPCSVKLKLHEYNQCKQ